MRLTEDFTLDELCHTDTGAVNVPNDCQKSKLQILASTLLQPIRNRWGRVKINSAFRSEFVNEKIGGAKTSQHLEGEAADINTLDAPLKDVFEWCRNNLIFGQLILEHKNDAWWIHISLPRLEKANQEILKFENGTYMNA